MLQKIKDLPEGVIGVEAHGRVETDDYKNVLTPLLDQAYKEGKGVRFLYHFTQDFTGFSPGAAWDDFRVGMQYLRLFDRCAVVTDSDWLAKSIGLAAFFMPCPVKTFPNKDLSTATEWLASDIKPKAVEATLIADKGVLVIEPKRALSSEDFEFLATIADPWIAQHGNLNGIVLHAKSFPGWENFGGLVRHIRFVKDHHKKVKRVAVAAEGTVMEMLPKIGAQFVDAEIKNFSYGDYNAAVEWASHS